LLTGILFFFRSKRFDKANDTVRVLRVVVYVVWATRLGRLLQAALV
jgi:hypothetical protein